MPQDTLAQMMLDAQGVTPAPANTASSPSTLDQMMADAQAVQRKPVPAPAEPKGVARSMLDAANAVSTGLGRGLVRTFNPVDVLANINDLGKAAIGAPYQAVTGKAPPDWLQVQNRAQTPGSAEWLLAQAAKNPVPSALVNPSDPRYEGGYLQAAGAGLAGIMNPSSIPAALGQATRGVISSIAGKGVYDLTGSEPAAITASLLPGGVGNRVTPAPSTPRSQVLADAQAKGFVVPPSIAGNTSWLNGLLEALAGKAALKQDANYQNLQTRGVVAGQSVGIPTGTPVTSDALFNLRQQVGNSGYAPIDSISDIPTTPTYANAILAMEQKYGRPSSVVTSLQNPAVSQLATDVIPPNFTGPEINTLIKNLREVGNKKAGAAYGTDPNTQELGDAQVATSRALEDLVNEHLTNQGPSNVVPNLLQARKEIAQNYTVQNALTNPDSGDVNVKPFVDRYRKGLPLEGDQLTIGQFGSMYPEFNRPNVTTHTPILSGGDLTAAAAGVVGGYMAGGANGALLGTVPALRAPTRSLLLSKWYQDHFANPSDLSNWSTQLTPEQQGALSQSLLSSGLLEGPQ